MHSAFNFEFIPGEKLSGYINREHSLCAQELRSKERGENEKELLRSRLISDLPEQHKKRREHPEVWAPSSTSKSWARNKVSQLSLDDPKGGKRRKIIPQAGDTQVTKQSNSPGSIHFSFLTVGMVKVMSTDRWFGLLCSCVWGRLTHWGGPDFLFQGPRFSLETNTDSNFRMAIKGSSELERP